MTGKLYFGLENSHNWGWDWFPSRDDAAQAILARPKLYGHNDAPLAMTRREIEAEGL